MAVRIDKDVAAGVLFLAAAGVGLAVGHSYPTGTAMRIGPGAFPFLLSIGLLVVGAAVLARGLLRRSSPMERPEWRAALAILGGTAIFFAIEHLGLVIASVLTVLVSSLAERRWHARAAIVTAAVLAVFSTLVFHWLLNTGIRLWPAL